LGFGSSKEIHVVSIGSEKPIDDRGRDIQFRDISAKLGLSVLIYFPRPLHWKIPELISFVIESMDPDPSPFTLDPAGPYEEACTLTCTPVVTANWPPANITTVTFPEPA
jgi:hypothetical protein